MAVAVPVFFPDQLVYRNKQISEESNKMRMAPFSLCCLLPLVPFPPLFLSVHGRRGDEHGRASRATFSLLLAAEEETPCPSHPFALGGDASAVRTGIHSNSIITLRMISFCFHYSYQRHTALFPRCAPLFRHF